MSALGRLGAQRGLHAVVVASGAISVSMRLAGAKALGRIGGEVARDRLVDLAIDADEDLDTRRAALSGLAQCVLPPELLARLSPRDLDDPLALPLLQLRVGAAEAAGGVGSGLGAEDIDRRLAAAIPGFQAARLEQRHREALQALRTAEYFYLPGFSLPPGLDAAPPALFWVKGLELWLDDLVGPLTRELARPAAQREVAELGGRWAGLRDVLAPSWRDDILDPGAGDLFSRLGEDTARELARAGNQSRVFGLRIVAFTLLAACDATVCASLASWRLGVSRLDTVGLANRLVALAAHRNRLTHRVAGKSADHGRVREAAVACANSIVRLRLSR